MTPQIAMRLLAVGTVVLGSAGVIGLCAVAQAAPPTENIPGSDQYVWKPKIYARDVGVVGPENGATGVHRILPLVQIENLSNDPVRLEDLRVLWSVNELGTPRPAGGGGIWRIGSGNDAVMIKPHSTLLLKGFPQGNGSYAPAIGILRVLNPSLIVERLEDDPWMVTLPAGEYLYEINVFPGEGGASETLHDSQMLFRVRD